MNVVVYGCDNSGKTSLANHIADKFGFEYVRSKGGPNMQTKEVLDYLEENLNNSKKSVFDRFSIIEEFTNGIVLRGKDRFDDEYIDKDHFLSQIDMFIYACPSMDTVKNFGDREQMDGIIDNIDKLRDLYTIFTENELACKGRPLFIFDWTKDSDYKKFDAWFEATIENAANVKKILDFGTGAFA